MNTIKTSELSGAALDWAVAKCEDVLERVELEQVNGVWVIAVPDLGCYFEPSTCWTQGGPIIERWGLLIRPQPGKQAWDSWKHGADDPCYTVGRTPLIAAMRCYVASKLGDEVVVPEELTP